MRRPAPSAVAWSALRTVFLWACERSSSRFLWGDGSCDSAVNQWERSHHQGVDEELSRGESEPPADGASSAEVDGARPRARQPLYRRTGLGAKVCGGPVGARPLFSFTRFLDPPTTRGVAHATTHAHRGGHHRRRHHGGRCRGAAPRAEQRRGRGRADLLGPLHRHQPVGRGLSGQRCHHQHRCTDDQLGPELQFRQRPEGHPGLERHLGAVGYDRARHLDVVQRGHRDRRHRQRRLPRQLVGQERDPDRLHPQRRRLRAGRRADRDSAEHPGDPAHHTDADRPADDAADHAAHRRLRAAQAARGRKQAGRLHRQAGGPARCEPFGHGVRLRAGQGDLRRPGRRRGHRRDQELEGRHRGPRPAQRGLLGRPELRSLRRRRGQLHRGDHRLGRPAGRARHHADRRTALVARHLHRQLRGLHGRQRDLPEADAGRAVRDPVLDQRGEHLQVEHLDRLRPVQRAVPGPRHLHQRPGLVLLAGRRHLPGHRLPGGGYAGHAGRGARNRCAERRPDGRPGLLQRPDRVAGARADRPDGQPGGGRSRIQLQLMRQQLLLGLPAGAGRGEGAAGGR
ncbi:putative Pyridine nucleotide-disulphide oxidoreductase [Actinacidiphila bryophytorum]|uniref:Pyridine nucleotide-disulphide oxidoreductase n=1 Tax=Actinacidiphila bryophytorum TaxID=1436133 RepID=A0A9W4GZC3_9ACTN|nr:putative Pyridine nucleotide-disulphide oxidoreductase [Actinacidiphila bryophytorum]